MKGVIKLMVTPFIFLKSLIYNKILINLKKRKENYEETNFTKRNKF